jgi:hypothetical protein
MDDKNKGTVDLSTTVPLHSSCVTKTGKLGVDVMQGRQHEEGHDLMANESPLELKFISEH